MESKKVTTIDKIVAWVGFILEIIKDGQEKYQKHFSKFPKAEVTAVVEPRTASFVVEAQEVTRDEEMIDQQDA